jgi:transcription elongation factor GreA
MTAEPAVKITSQVTLGEALIEYLPTLKPEQRHLHEAFVRNYVEYAGDATPISTLTGSRVESYVESRVKASDPNAPERVMALKNWFQYLKKKNYSAANFGVHVRVKRPVKRSGAQVRVVQEPLAMTEEGIANLRAELDEINRKIPDMQRAIEVARSDGDLRENAPYHAAREDLAFTNARRDQLENSLKRAVTVARQTEGSSALGSTVTVTRLDSGKPYRYKLVGAREANAAEQKISVESPVGSALLGRSPGEEVAVDAPSGQIHFRIEAVVHD